MTERRTPAGKLTINRVEALIAAVVRGLDEMRADVDDEQEQYDSGSMSEWERETFEEKVATVQDAEVALSIFRDRFVTRRRRS